MLDGYGGLHPFSASRPAGFRSLGTGPPPPLTVGGTYWQGWDIARKVVIFSDGTGGYVLDGYGGLHGFGVGRPAPPDPKLTAYWAGFCEYHEAGMTTHRPRMLGFEAAGVFQGVGFKLGRWHDVGWWQRSIVEAAPVPEPPIPFSALRAA